MKKRERSPSPPPLQPYTDDDDDDEKDAVELDDLSDEQREAYRLAVEEGTSIFITGGAGTGKSFLLRKIIAGLRKTYRSSTYVTAMTGVAALNIGGSTLHSFAGCGMISPSVTIDKIRATVRKQNWKNCRTLIIDEISMMDAHFFGLLDDIARHIRPRNLKPFGGIQLILSGDFLQLPPVNKNENTNNASYRSAVKRERASSFCFLSPKWLELDPTLCMLSKPFRQRDADFFKLLNQMRLEKLDDHSVAVLKRMSTSSSISFVSPMQGKGGTDIFTNELGEVESEEFQGYTCLRPRNKDVAWVNMLYYNKLKTTEYTYVTHISTGRPNVTGVPFLDPLSLREGCRVMLIKNINVSLGLVNGSVGVITKFINYKQNGYTVKSYPNYLSHICKGVDNHFNRTHTMLPVVLFSIYRSDGSKTECEIVVEPQEWEELLGDRVQSRYSQIPLVLAYALTIHKAQGMSLNKVDIDFNGTFEAGQAYVALSRCTNLTTVKLHNFMVSVAFQDEVALSYYKAAEACIENNRNETHSSPKRLNRQIEDLRQRVPELEEQARALSSLIRSRSTPMHQLKEAKVVFDITALYEIGVKGPDRFDPLFQQDNMIRVPLVVMEMLQSIREQMGDDTQEEEEEEENDDNDSTDSSGASVSTIKQMIDFIEKGKQAFVVDFQRAGGEGRSQVCEELPPPLPEYAKYRDLLPLVETDEDRDENVFALNLLSNDPRERQMHLDILQYALWLRVTYGGSVVLCTSNAELAAQGLAFGLLVTFL